MRRIARVLLATALVVIVSAGSMVPAQAGEAKTHVGIQPLGFGITPNQYVFGFQAALGEVKFARFAPSIHFGFGDDQTLASVNLDVLLDVFSPPRARAGFYVGAGLGLHMISFDDEKGDTETDTEFGVNVVAGLKLPFAERHYYNLESRFGIDIGEVPDFRLLLGVMFGFGEPD